MEGIPEDPIRLTLKANRTLLIRSSVQRTGRTFVFGPRLCQPVSMKEPTGSSAEEIKLELPRRQGLEDRS
jgi:hypothetical protein